MLTEPHQVSASEASNLRRWLAPAVIASMTAELLDHPERERAWVAFGGRGTEPFEEIALLRRGKLGKVIFYDLEALRYAAECRAMTLHSHPPNRSGEPSESDLNLSPRPDMMHVGDAVLSLDLAGAPLGLWLTRVPRSAPSSSYRSVSLGRLTLSAGWRRKDTL
ncbi:MAG: hypothetical protein ABJB33_01235 [Gemmatimonadota bacterium]